MGFVSIRVCALSTAETNRRLRLWGTLHFVRFVPLCGER